MFSFLSYLEPGQEYTYTVQAVTSQGLTGPPSPPLLYLPGQGFCGDGKVDKSIGEECDDGNLRDADGCNMQCKKEDVFHCTGEYASMYIFSQFGRYISSKRATIVNTEDSVFIEC